MYGMYGWALTDGSRLVNARPLGPTSIKLHQRVAVGGHVFRVTNLRGAGLSGRLVELDGHPPVHLRPGDRLTGFEVAPPYAPDVLLSFMALNAPPARPPRKRRAGGVGRVTSDGPGG